MDWPSLLLAGFAVLFIGVAKAGFGGGLGMLVTPLCVLAFGPKAAIGILLPLLCAGDAFSLYHYWRKWRAENLKFLLPGTVVGVVIGVQLVGQFSPRQLNNRHRTDRSAVRSVPVHQGAHLSGRKGCSPRITRVGLPCGVGMGITLDLRPRRWAGGGDVPDAAAPAQGNLRGHERPAFHLRELDQASVFSAWTVRW